MGFIFWRLQDNIDRMRERERQSLDEAFEEARAVESVMRKWVRANHKPLRKLAKDAPTSEAK